jgi:chromosome segregation ATPase
MKFKFQISDNQKFDFLWSLLNPNCNEENDWVIEYAICDIYDEYALVYNYNEGIYERVYYTKDNENDTLSIDRKERCYILDLSENEKNALDAIRAMNNNTYELIDEKFASIANLENQISENNTKLEELNGELSTLITERDELNSQKTSLQAEFDAISAQYAEAQTSIEALTNERNALVAYKKNVEDEAKKAVADAEAKSASANAARDNAAADV